jgi:hypothetical protein
MPAIIYGFPAGEWECEKCNFRNVDTAQTCHRCQALRLPSATIAPEIPTTTRMYREPREVGFNAMPLFTIALCIGTVIAICALLYFLMI